MPAAATARFMLSATHWREMSRMGRLAVLGVNIGQVGQAFHQVRGDRDLAALAGLVPGASGRTLMTGGYRLRRRFLAAQGQGLRDPEPGTEHDAEGHACGEAGSGRDEGVGFLGREIVRKFL